MVRPAWETNHVWDYRSKGRTSELLGRLCYPKKSRARKAFSPGTSTQQETPVGKPHALKIGSPTRNNRRGQNPNACDLSVLSLVRVLLPSFLRKQESSSSQLFWTPAFAGVTTKPDSFLLNSPVLGVNPSLQFARGGYGRHKKPAVFSIYVQCIDAHETEPSPM